MVPVPPAITFSVTILSPAPGNRFSSEPASPLLLPGTMSLAVPRPTPRFQLRFTFELPTERRYLDGTLLAILAQVEEAAAAARRVGGGDPGPSLDLERIRVALREALANAAEHGNRYQPERTIRVQGRVDGESLWVEVEDEGEGFDPDAVLEDLQDADRRRERGRGLLFMRGIADELRHEQGGCRVVLRFDRREP